MSWIGFYRKSRKAGCKDKPTPPHSALNRYLSDMKIAFIRYAAWLGLFLPFLPYLIWQQDAYVRLHDTLEGELVWLEVLRQSGLAFDFSSDAMLPSILGGLPRNSYPSAHSLPYIFVHIFGMFWGYVGLSFILALIGFLGMRQWVNQLYPQAPKGLPEMAGLLFSWIPFFPTFGAAVMGLPWLWLSFRRMLQQRSTAIDVLLWFVFPFMASFIWTVILLGFAWLWVGLTAIRRRQWSTAMLLSGLVWGFGVLLAHYPAFALMFSGFESHRQEYLPYPDGAPAILPQLQNLIQMFAFSHYHVGTIVTLPIAFLLLMVWPQLGRRAKTTFYVLMGILLFQAFYPSLEFWMFQHVDLLRSLRLDRLSPAFPVLWLFALIDATLVAWNQDSTRRLALMVWGAVFLTTGLGNDQHLQNLRKAIDKDIMPSYRAYLAEDQMKKIQWYIGKSPETYRVASIGLSPTIAQYNGFYTVDGLQSQYPLKQKQAMRAIMDAELQKNPECKAYFEHWGNRCYLFSAELGCGFDAIHQGKGKRGQIQSLELNGEAMKAAGLDYLLSAVKLPDSHQYQHLRSFHNGDSWWTIHLYQIQHP